MRCQELFKSIGSCILPFVHINNAIDWRWPGWVRNGFMFFSFFFFAIYAFIIDSVWSVAVRAHAETHRTCHHQDGFIYNSNVWFYFSGSTMFHALKWNSFFFIFQPTKWSSFYRILSALYRNNLYRLTAFKWINHSFLNRIWMGDEGALCVCVFLILLEVISFGRNASNTKLL